MRKKWMLTLALGLMSLSMMASYGYTMGNEPQNTAITAPWASSPAYVTAVSGDMQPFGQEQPAAYASLNAGPPSTDKGDPINPDIRTPIGDIDWVCALLPLGYMAVVWARRQRRKNAAKG